MDYFHLTPSVMTDDIFFQYVENVVYTGTADQRQAAYLWSEQRFIDFAGCPIYATTVTGSYPYEAAVDRVALQFGRVISIDAVTVISLTDCRCTLDRTFGCGTIVNSQHGYIDMQVVNQFFYGACGRSNVPYLMEVAYTTGFPTGAISQDTSLHMALSVGAEIMLNEIVDPAANEGGPGDPGIKNYSELGYSETKLSDLREIKLPGPWGASARARMIVKMIPQYKMPKRTLIMGRRRGGQR